MGVEEAGKMTLYLLIGLMLAKCVLCTNEYMKREHSLVRPFQGESAVRGNVLLYVFTYAFL